MLRRVLGDAKKLSPIDAAEISRNVFAFYRWFGWLDARLPLSKQIPHAREIDAAFQKNPASISVAELVQKAIPQWVSQHMDASAAWARAIQFTPKLWLRARLGQGAALVKKLKNCRLLREGGDALQYLGREDLFRTAEFRNGEFEIQDISSQIVGLICAPKAGEIWWDACAGEGGKALHLSDLMQNQGLIWASDRAEWRLQKLKRRAARAKTFNYRSAVWNGGAKLPTKTKFDGVLLDAPCSGIGTWARNPHARWTTRESDVLELAEVQKELLAHAAPSLKPGGSVIYSVCTMAREETADVAHAFEQSSPGFERIAIRSPFTPDIAAQSELWLWPQNCQGNGMFVAAWRKRG